jgi:Chaperone of endosialidase
MKVTRFVLAISLGCLTTTLAVDPPPDGGYLNENTAEGEDALFSLTTGSSNTGVGYEALYNIASNDENTAIGARALYSGTFCEENTAVGSDAMSSITTGDYNTAVGWHSLGSAATGDGNVALGYSALDGSSIGSNNIAIGVEAMQFGTTGSGNVGIGAYVGTSSGSDNVAIGDKARGNTNAGSFNTGLGYSALSYGTGSHNIGLGAVAGVALTTGSHNIDIGNQGSAEDEKTIRIGNRIHHRTFIAGISNVTVADGVAVVVGAQGQLGTMTSSARYKEAIQPMKDASDVILSLRPVTFRYKKNLDPKATPQFGLVAEDVAKVDPDLVARDDKGEPYTVRYEAVNAMLLNEFLKEHERVKSLEETIGDQQKALDSQQEQIDQLREAMRQQ